VQVIEAPGHCVIDEVGMNTSSLSYNIGSLTKKVLAAPKPVFYSSPTPQTPVYEENEDVYTRNKYFPGRLVEYSVSYDSKEKTTITMQLYLLQYNPVTSELVILNDFKVLVRYHVEQNGTPPEKMVVITTSALNETRLVHSC
jgi:hypothetical protein